VKYSIVTFGCRVNQADSLRLEEEFRARGAAESPAAAADVVIVNTCSVTASADQGARQTIRRVARENPSAKIVVTGCYATRCAADVEALPGVIRVVANDSKLNIAGLLEDCGVLTTSARFGEGDGPCGAGIEPGAAGRTCFTLRVQTGCEERCSYCIIPTTRGASRSIPVEDIVRTVVRVAASGFKEIALTGVHLGSYGRDLEPRRSLRELLRALCDVPADVTFRISSLEPMDCTPEIVDLVASSGGRCAPHFHLPLQHASDRMLRQMRRPYTFADYRRLLDRIAARLPHASIGTDLIAGFPGESDRDFDAGAAYLPASPLSHLHVFPYSDRPGTDAAALPEKVPGPVIRERGARLRQIGSVLSAQFQAAQAGTIRPGLTLEDGTLVVTDNYLKVRIPAGVKRNERVRVRLTGAGSGVVVGAQSSS
jgi:threonylcarbamoyladenosine tRNA methylthiotransferase MtaB